MGGRYQVVPRSPLPAADRPQVPGRGRELAVLRAVLDEHGARAVFVNGIAGVGKSTLLGGFAAEARTAGAAVVEIDCRDVEPTERGFLTAVGDAIGAGATLREVVGRLERLGRSVVVLDSYELLRLLDTWLASCFLPVLPANARLVVAGREEPTPPWFAVEGFRALALGPLASEHAVALLTAAGMRRDEATRVNRVVRGHPLGLAVASATERRDREISEVAGQRVMEELTRIYLEDLGPLARRALSAASVVRRATVPLLSAMLPEAAPQDAYERLHALPFIEARPDGLMVHEAIQHVAATELEAADPERHRGYRRAAWRQLRGELRSSPARELWRYTADMLFLIQNPVVREAFFPAGAYPLVVEPATPADAEAILAIAARHEPATAAALVDSWWHSVPESFYVVRDSEQSVTGFSCVLADRPVPQRLVREDPVLQRWREHLRSDPLPKGQTALFHRWWLDRDLGEGPSPAQAATWLDIKRLYMERRPDLRRVYGVVRALDTYLSTFQQLGFEPLTGDPIQLDGVANYCAVLDFGPASVDGWLTWLAASELGIDEDRILDLEQRALVFDGKRVPLTRLELELMRYLSEREGKPVSRAAILHEVWGYDPTYASNVVDVVVRSLRKKLGQRADAIETVRGVGYRFRPDH